MTLVTSFFSKLICAMKDCGCNGNDFRRLNSLEGEPTIRNMADLALMPPTIAHTVIKPGNFIGWQQAGPCLYFLDEYGNHVFCWQRGGFPDNKTAARFLKTAFEFKDFAFLLAQMHGLKLSRAKFPVPGGGLVFRFNRA